MTMPLMKPRRKNPVLRTRQMNLPPWARGRTALGMTAAAAEGRFELQVCRRCRAVQYPPRDACHRCLSPQLKWTPQNGAGELLSETVLHHSNDPFYRERLPWRLGLVHLDAGPTVIVHLHGDVPAPRTKETVRVHVGARLDRAGAAVLIGFPPEESEHMADDKMLREMTSDPKFRKVLVTDGKTAVGQAIVRALVKAGAEIVWVGHAEPWKKLPGLDDITALPQVTLVPLDLTNGRSVAELAGEIGGKVDIVINNAEVHRAFGIAARRGTDVAKAEMDINYFGLLRLAQEFGPALKARSADGDDARCGVGEPALGLRALELSAARHVLGVEGRGAFARAVPARRDAAERHPRHQRVPGTDRRRVEPEPAAAEGRAGCARERDRQGAEGRNRGRLSGRRRAGVGRAVAREPESAGAGVGRWKLTAAHRCAGGRLVRRASSARAIARASSRSRPRATSISSAVSEPTSRHVARPSSTVTIAASVPPARRHTIAGSFSRVIR